MEKNSDRYKSTIKKATRSNYVKGGIAIIIITIGLIYSGQKDEKKSKIGASQNSSINKDLDRKDSQPEKKKVTLPSFELVSEETSDKPIKTQVEQHILIKNLIHPENIRALLNSQYNEINDRTAYKHHDRATNVYIYVYDSQEKANSKGYSWIASLQKGYNESPNIKIKREQIKINKQKPEAKFGLSESKRKNIFFEIVTAQDKARETAIARKPDDWEGQLDLETHLQKKYEKELAQNHEINQSIIDSISLEGVTKQWPKPEL